MDINFGLKVNALDNVATVFANSVQAGDVVTVRDKKGNEEEITSLNEIPYGHKIAIKAILKGEPIMKYGEKLGVASTQIAKGAHVHVHNLESVRGRGDL